MAVNYTQTLSIDMIVTEIEALLDWRNQLYRRCFFPAAQSRAPDPQAPAALLTWCRRSGGGVVDPKAVERMALVHDELCRTAARIAEHSKDGAQPTLELYDSFEIQFEGFITQIRRLHQDISDGGIAVDAVTGLRTVSGLHAEMRREQDRYDRKGTSFSVASIEIDNLSALERKYDRRQMDSVFAGVAQMIARMVRSFDDAYFLGKGEYLVTLKHVDFMDACAVMDRLRQEIGMTPLALPGGDKVKVTASFGVAEAIPRETPELTLRNAKGALARAKGDGGDRVAEYREKSVLEQYARDVGPFQG